MTMYNHLIMAEKLLYNDYTNNAIDKNMEKIKKKLLNINN
nr:hypothetical protein [Microctonus hyperodae filamentous virus]